MSEREKTKKCFMYILECANGKFYTGSTNSLKLRLEQHYRGEGSNYTRKYLPVRLVHLEEFENIALAFKREKQVQNWSRAKKLALINNTLEELPGLSKGKYHSTKPGNNRS